MYGIIFNFFVYVCVAFHHKYPFLWLLSALTAGILCNCHLSFIPYLFLFLTGCKLIFKISGSLSDILLLTGIFCCGLYLSTPPVLQPDSAEIYYIRSRCEEKLPHDNYILSACNQKFYLSHYYTDTNYRPGDSLAFYSRILPVHENNNPGEFSYARYLKQKEVFYRLHPVSPITRSGHSRDVYSFFQDLRQDALQKTARLFTDTIQRNLINALCLGYKTDLNEELEQLFTTTGTIHLLSVSGLHTGAIYLFLLFLLKLFRLNGHKTELLILPLLWSYACLTGLSPSVTRAATILSFITFGKAFSRTYTPLNSIAASAFFTLLLRPYTLFSLSFLLSYSAYSGIVLLYPYLFNLPGRLPHFYSKIYACCCITLAAQLPTLPLTAYYFHTINISGFLANLLAVPLATILLYSSATCLILPYIVSQYLSFIPELCSRLLLSFLQFVTPISINIPELYPSSGNIILIYIILISGVLFLIRRNFRWMITTNLSLALLCLLSVFSNLHHSSQKELVIFHRNRKSSVLVNYQGYYSSLRSTPGDSLYIQPYILQHKLQSLPAHTGLITTQLYSGTFQLSTNQKTIGIVTARYPNYQECHILIVTDNLSPAKIFNPSLTGTLPHTIITDGSNHRFTTQSWSDFCKHNNIHFYNTQISGCLRIPIK